VPRGERAGLVDEGIIGTAQQSRLLQFWGLMLALLTWSLCHLTFAGNEKR
jgi:hypothetical protein